MNKVILSVLVCMLSISACDNTCVNDVLLQTITMDLRINSDNLGILASEPQNDMTVIRSETNQFYNYPDFRRFGQYRQPASLLLASAHAAPCIDQEEYISRMDAAKTELRLDVAYDASAVGLGVVPPDSNLLAIDAIRNNFLLDFETNSFLNAGAPAALTISKNFFAPINQSQVTFHFRFTELDGTIFEDEAVAFIDINF